MAYELTNNLSGDIWAVDEFHETEITSKDHKTPTFERLFHRRVFTGTRGECVAMLKHKEMVRAIDGLALAIRFSGPAT